MDIILTMSRQRKTKKEKVHSQERKQRTEGFVIKDEWLGVGAKKPYSIPELLPGEKKFFKTDLTKTLLLTMLVLALELAIWNYLSRH